MHRPAPRHGIRLEIVHPDFEVLRRREIHAVREGRHDAAPLPRQRARRIDGVEKERRHGRILARIEIRIEIAPARDEVLLLRRARGVVVEKIPHAVLVGALHAIGAVREARRIPRATQHAHLVALRDTLHVVDDRLSLHVRIGEAHRDLAAQVEGALGVRVDAGEQVGEARHPFRGEEERAVHVRRHRPRGFLPDARRVLRGSHRAVEEDAAHPGVLR